LETKYKGIGNNSTEWSLLKKCPQPTDFIACFATEKTRTGIVYFSIEYE
jgi:hypothetical protein